MAKIMTVFPHEMEPEKLAVAVLEDGTGIVVALFPVHPYGSAHANRLADAFCNALGWQTPVTAPPEPSALDGLANYLLVVAKGKRDHASASPPRGRSVGGENVRDKLNGEADALERWAGAVTGMTDLLPINGPDGQQIGWVRSDAAKAMAEAGAGFSAYSLSFGRMPEAETP